MRQTHGGTAVALMERGLDHVPVDETDPEWNFPLERLAYPFLPARPRAVGWEEIVALADLGLYAVKRSGRNGWAGVEAGETAETGAVLQRFRNDPESSIARSEVKVHTSREEGHGLQWT